MKTYILTALALVLAAAGCVETPTCSSKEDVYVSPGEVVIYQPCVNYILEPGPPADVSGIEPKPEVAFVGAGGINRNKFVAGKPYVFFHDPRSPNYEMACKRPVRVFPGQPFVFDKGCIYLLTPGPLMDSGDPNKVKVFFFEKGIRSKFTVGETYALLPNAEMFAKDPKWRDWYNLQYGLQPSGQAQATAAGQQPPPPNEQRIIVQHVNDPTYDLYMQQQMQRQSMQDFRQGLNNSFNKSDQILGQIRGNNDFMLNYLDAARQQDQFYRQRR